MTPVILTTIAIVSDMEARQKEKNQPAEKYPGPQYEVLASLDRNIEIRLYSPRVVAQVEVAGDQKTALNEGFRILAAYIFGNNNGRQKIEMMAPVAAQPEKIPMTSPVTASGSAGALAVRFFMPQRYSLTTLPSPSDERIKLVELPPQRFAAIRFSGFWNRANFSRHADRLLECLRRNNLEPSGPPVNAYYNPPYALPFMRRNEVLVPLDGAEAV
jgi:hypothetical protein